MSEHEHDEEFLLLKATADRIGNLLDEMISADVDGDHIIKALAFHLGYLSFQAGCPKGFAMEMVCDSFDEASEEETCPDCGGPMEEHEHEEPDEMAYKN